MLERPSQPGLNGAVVDALRLATGAAVACMPCHSPKGQPTAGSEVSKRCPVGLTGALYRPSSACPCLAGIRILPLSLFSVFTLLPPTAALALQVAITGEATPAPARCGWQCGAACSGTSLCHPAHPSCSRHVEQRWLLLHEAAARSAVPPAPSGIRGIPWACHAAAGGSAAAGVTAPAGAAWLRL